MAQLIRERRKAHIHTTKVYAPTGATGRLMARAQTLQADIARLESELGELRTTLLAQMEAQGLDRLEVGDFRATRKFRHNWTYTAPTQREILALRQRQIYEQREGLAFDSPTIYVALSHKESAK